MADESPQAPVFGLRSLMRSKPLPKAVRWGIVAVASLDWVQNAMLIEPGRPFESAVQLFLLSCCLLLAWRPAWGVVLLLGLLPVTLQLNHISVALIPLTVMIGIGASTCARPLVILLLLAVSGWLLTGLLTGRMLAQQSMGLLVFWGLVAMVGLSFRRFAGERSRDRARLQQLEIERAEIIDAERRAIARELHDVVAHAVSVIAVQARAAKFDPSPDAAHTALDQIGDLSREALADLRRLLRVLAAERDPTEDSTPAEWNVFELRGQLISLVDTMTSLGIQVEVDIPNEDPPLPRSVATAVYRIAQEATTNVVKHVGPDARCRFSLDVDDHRVELVLFNTPARATVDSALSSGFGLDSMRERVHMFDGTLVAGPAEVDGWQVRAVIPLRF